MGLRQAWGRLRSPQGGGHGDRVDRSADSPSRTREQPVYRHQADPATGELIRVGEQQAPAEPQPAPPAPTASPHVRPDWLRDEPARPSPQPRDSSGRDYGAATNHGPRPAADDAADDTPAPDVAGGLVVGPARRRHEDVELPSTYSPSPQPYDRAAVREAWDLVADRADTLVRNFYAELFLRLGREALSMFPTSMESQRQDFGKALIQWVVTDDPDAMTAHLQQLGADHRKFAVEPRHYDAAGQALLGAWKQLLGTQWSDRIEAAVLGSYTRLASTMIDAAMAARDEQAVWGATVIGHERVRDDFAIVHVQPDSPYGFHAGQYLTVELASRSREWRRMSIASAPRADNTLTMHVRSVNNTGVASTLVAGTAVGDRLRLGPPRGNNLVVEPGTLGAGGLLCVAAGTGAAPMVAVVESMLSWPQCPPVYVFVGARKGDDLVPAEMLARTVMAAGRADSVQVYGVVSNDPEYTGLRGKVEDVVPTLKDWAQLGVDVLIAGPDTMIHTTVFGLIGRGVPAHRIHFDQYDSSE